MYNVVMKIIQDTDKAIEVMHNVGCWMKESGLSISQWWMPENMNAKFLLKHTEPDEYYVGLVDDKAVASMILQESERNQSWKTVDGDNPQKALYLHWLCVHRDYAGKGYSIDLVEFAKKEAFRRGFKLLRLDTDANNPKLCSLYEGAGFVRMGTEAEGGHNTAFYQVEV